MNTHEYYVVDRGFKDINPIVAGVEKCESGHKFGPAIRGYYLIHYICDGKGYIYNESGKHTAKKGDIFIIKPGERVTYRASKKEPWHYIWIGFTGERAKKLDKITETVIPYYRNSFYDIPDCERYVNTREEFLAGKAFEIMSELFNDEKAKPNYIRQVTDYISANYMNNISIENISDALGLDRRYLSRIFKAKMGKGLQEYLIDTRINYSKQLLKEDYAVKEVASMVGYNDEFNFSKMFKKKTGVSPREYKNRHH